LHGAAGAVLARAISVCPHLRPGMVALTALWVPGRMVCTACLDMLALAGEEDRRCDRCGVVAPAGQIRPAMTSLAPSGAPRVLLGLCPTRSGHEVAA
jgi:tRNA(Ile2) C34 agmatinyltransferase TiaS